MVLKNSIIGLRFAIFGKIIVSHFFLFLLLLPINQITYVNENQAGEGHQNIFPKMRHAEIRQNRDPDSQNKKYSSLPHKSIIPEETRNANSMKITASRKSHSQ